MRSAQQVRVAGAGAAAAPSPAAARLPEQLGRFAACRTRRQHWRRRVQPLLLPASRRLAPRSASPSPALCPWDPQMPPHLLCSLLQPRCKMLTWTPSLTGGCLEAGSLTTLSSCCVDRFLDRLGRGQAFGPRLAAASFSCRCRRPGCSGVAVGKPGAMLQHHACAAVAAAPVAGEQAGAPCFPGLACPAGGRCAGMPHAAVPKQHAQPVASEALRQGQQSRHGQLAELPVPLQPLPPPLRPRRACCTLPGRRSGRLAQQLPGDRRRAGQPQSVGACCPGLPGPWLQARACTAPLLPAPPCSPPAPRNPLLPPPLSLPACPCPALLLSTAPSSCSQPPASLPA